MLIILYSMLFSYMTFFTICIAPVINTVLESKTSSTLLRKIFPRNFIYGLVLSFALVIFSFVEKELWSLSFSSIIFILYLANLYFIMPKINEEADKFKEKSKYTKRFKLLHLYSVLFYVLQIILSVIAIVKLYF